MKQVTKAKAFAIRYHKGQKYGEAPYTYHLDMVCKTLQKYKVTDQDMLAAAWLHDVVEDTEVTIDMVRAEFGDRVADLVWAVTNEAGVNRAARHVRTYQKLKEMQEAVTLKLADRIANVTHSVETKNDGKMKMYAKEWTGFFETLYTPGVNEKMWTDLHDLQFERKITK